MIDWPRKLPPAGPARNGAGALDGARRIRHLRGMVSSRLLLLLPSSTYRAGAFVDAARRLGVDLTVGSDHRSTMTPLQPTSLLQVDLADGDRACAQAAAFHADHALSAVVGVDDDTTVLAARISAALGLTHPSPAACEAARDKALQREILARASVPVPRFELHRVTDDLAAIARTNPYPCVLKPTRLAMSRGVMRADDPVQFVERAERLRRILAMPDAAAASGSAVDVFLVETFVPGREFAVEGLLQSGELTVLAVFDKPDPLDGPFFEETIYVTPSRLPAAEQARVVACVAQAATALGLADGPVHAEVRLNEQGPWLIELAARPIGGRCSAVLRFGPKSETSLEELLLRRALGERLGPEDLSREASAAAVLMIPTTDAGTLRGVEGVADARLVPWVDDVAITAHPGQELVPLPEGSRYLGFIFARAPDPATAEEAVRRAHTMLRIALA
jgi:biotin carboxylase